MEVEGGGGASMSRRRSKEARRGRTSLHGAPIKNMRLKTMICTTADKRKEDGNRLTRRHIT